MNIDSEEMHKLVSQKYTKKIRFKYEIEYKWLSFFKKMFTSKMFATIVLNSIS